MFLCHMCDLLFTLETVWMKSQGFWRNFLSRHFFFLLVFTSPDSTPHTRTETKHGVKDGYFFQHLASPSEAGSLSKTPKSALGQTGMHSQLVGELWDGNCAPRVMTWTFLHVLVLDPVVVVLKNTLMQFGVDDCVSKNASFILDRGGRIFGFTSTLLRVDKALFGPSACLRASLQNNQWVIGCGRLSPQP